MSGYEKLDTADSDQEIHLEHGTTCKCTSRRALIPWIWCSICTLITVLAVVSSLVPGVPQWPTSKHTNKFPTDFISVPEIPLKEEYFYNFYDFNPSNGVLEFNHTGVPRLYAGYPERRIDDAWSELLSGTYMATSKEEQEAVRKVAPWDLGEIGGEVYMQLGVFHSLHYLDLVRRALEPEIYDVNNDFTAQLDRPEWKKVHIYHCIDQLRHAIQCQSDLTPVPLFAVDSLPKRFYATHSVSHTCRDFDAVRGWVDERNKVKEPFNWNSWTS